MSSRGIKTLLLTLLVSVALAANLPVSVSVVSWSSEKRLTWYTGSTNILSSVTQISDGRVWVLWQSKRSGYPDFDVYYKIYNFTVWSKDVRLVKDVGDDINPYLVQLENQTMFLAWASNRYGNNEIFYKTSSDNGLNWTDPVRLTTTTGDDTNPAVVQLRNGSIWMVWRRRVSNNDEIFYRLYNGSAWGSEVQFTNSSALDRMPSIVQTKDGRVWIFWSSIPLGGDNGEIFYRIYDGSSWTGDLQLTESISFLDMDPHVVQTRDGDIWVVWYGHDPSRRNWQDDLFYKTSSDNGVNWSGTTQLTFNSTNDAWPAIAQVSDKKLWVVWSGDASGNFDVYYKTSDELTFHDVAITNIFLSETEVYQGANVSVSVVASNQGDFIETFTVECYANSTLLGSENIALSPQDSTTLVWNMSGFAPGVYTISATASAVPEEDLIDMDNNALVDGTVQVKILGDVNGDGAVGLLDLNKIEAAFGATPGDPGWDEEADINRDGIVDALDLAIVGKHYGETV